MTVFRAQFYVMSVFRTIKKRRAYRIALDNFEAIKKVEQKCQMGIITAAERDKEIEALLM